MLSAQVELPSALDPIEVRRAQDDQGVEPVEPLEDGDSALDPELRDGLARFAHFIHGNKDQAAAKSDATAAITENAANSGGKIVPFPAKKGAGPGPLQARSEAGIVAYLLVKSGYEVARKRGELIDIIV